MKIILLLVILLIIAAGMSILFYSTPNRTSKEKQKEIEKTSDLAPKDVNGPRDSAASFFSYIYAGEYTSAAYRFLPKAVLNKLEQSGKLNKFQDIVSANIPRYDLGKIKVYYADENKATCIIQLIEDPDYHAI